MVCDEHLLTSTVLVLKKPLRIHANGWNPILPHVPHELFNTHEGCHPGYVSWLFVHHIFVEGCHPGNVK